MNSRSKRAWYLVGAFVVLLGVGFLQTGIDPLYPQFLPKQQVLNKHEVKETGLMLELPQQFLGLAMMGFREMAAGLLWVRADEFFHEGDYNTLIPLIRLATILDPHQLTIYSTGAWHMDYNFVDSDQRSDRRYIPASIAMMKEAIANNPGNYDPLFELAWTHYHQKIKYHDKAAEWAAKSATLPDIDANTGKKISHPAFVDRMVAHLYEQAGMIDQADAQWKKVIAERERALKRNPKDYMAKGDIVLSKKNYDLFLLRRAWRQTDVYPPIDVNFNADVKRIAPRTLLIKGSANLVPASEFKDLVSEATTHYWRDKYPTETWRDGCRIDIILTDADYDYLHIPELSRFTWDLDQTKTILVDTASVRGGKFEVVVDMSKDRDIYSFTAKKYKLMLLFNPLDAPDYIQDRIGWHGEGITDKRYLDKTTIPGVNMIKWEKIYDRKDLM